MLLFLLSAAARAQLGDFNQDGLWNCDDIDPLSQQIPTGVDELFYDMNGDGLIKRADLDDWLQVGGAQSLVSGLPYLSGDGNLDGIADISDLMIWNSNKFDQGTGWCEGNFTTDGLTDVSDFNVWNANKFTTSPAWVPEPVVGWQLAWLLAAVWLPGKRALMRR